MTGAPQPDAPEGLRRFEEWMLAVVSHPGGVAAGVGCEDALAALPESASGSSAVVLPSKQCSENERLEVYANMYFWRLIDILAEDFPATRFLIGADRFYELAKSYLVTCPSRHYSLAFLGDRFADFVRTCDDDVPHREFASDVARIETAVEDVFDLTAKDPIDTDDLLSVPPDSWNDVKLETTAALRLLALSHPADDWLEAFREERQVDIPTPEDSWLLVHRQNLSVWRVDLSREEFTVLSALNDGKSLGDALEECLLLPGVDEDHVFQSVGEWFHRWGAKGLFTGTE